MRYTLNGILLEIVNSFRYEGEESRIDLQQGDQCFELKSIDPLNKNNNGRYTLIVNSQHLSTLELA